MDLCELAAKETDSAKLLALVQEINRIIAEKDISLKAGIQGATPPIPNRHSLRIGFKAAVQSQF